MSLPQLKPVDERIRDRLYEQIKRRRKLLTDQRVVEKVLVTTTERISEYLDALNKEITNQQAAIGHFRELREEEEDQAHYEGETAVLGVNLADVFFRSDFRILVKHLSVAEDDVIISALTKENELLQRLKDLIRIVEESGRKEDLND